MSLPEMTSPVSPSGRQASPPVDLRHMTSNPALLSPGKEHRGDKLSKRTSQTLSPTPRLGSRSPSSIPSSPTSVHSSSSAIFERDIEPIVSPTSPSATSHLPPNPHRIPRAKTSEHLDQAVPTVLDSAAEILTGLQEDDLGLDLVSVEAPATSIFDRSRGSGFASPIGSLRSRSPSPIGSRPGNRNSLLLSIPSPSQVIQNQPGIPHVSTPIPAQSVSPTSASPPISGGALTARPPAGTATSANAQGFLPGGSSTPPSIITPTSTYFSTASSAESSPTATTREPAPALPGSPSATAQNFAASQASQNMTSPPSPTHAATKRLSFMSYTDLLTSTPASTLPLSQLTTSAVEPPPHIPSVGGGFSNAGSVAGGSAAASLRGFPTGNRDSVILLDDVGGEWEREGMGSGLEARLEALLPVGGSKA